MLMPQSVRIARLGGLSTARESWFWIWPTFRDPVTEVLSSEQVARMSGLRSSRFQERGGACDRQCEPWW
jgi:hypothetical protein